MIVIKYRMIIENGYVETLDFNEAEIHGNYITIEEDIDNSNII